jgi:hypothetical protein
LERFRRMLSQWRGRIIFHNWFYDEKVMRALALSVPHRHLVDTMARVYHLGNLPQGLKALAFRELGMLMEDFEDVVRPYSTARVLSFYMQAQTYKWEKPEPRLELTKEGLWKKKQPQTMNTKLKRFFTDYGKDPEKNVFGSWDNWEDSHEMLEEKLGKWPGMCISHVPFDKVLRYACRDADAALRLWHLVKRIERQVRRMTQERWAA